MRSTMRPRSMRPRSMRAQVHEAQDHEAQDHEAHHEKVHHGHQDVHPAMPSALAMRFPHPCRWRLQPQVLCRCLALHQWWDHQALEAVSLHHAPCQATQGPQQSMPKTAASSVMALGPRVLSQECWSPNQNSSYYRQPKGHMEPAKRGNMKVT